MKSNEISRDEVIELLIKTCPSYRKRWEEYVQDNYEGGDEQLLYNDLTDFASHIVELYKNNQLYEFPGVFALIEQLHINGV